VDAEVLPFWVEGLDQSDLFGTRPAFELLLAQDSVSNLFECLAINELIDFVPRGEVGATPLFVLMDPAGKVIRYADV
jgi:hypothetical protein